MLGFRLKNATNDIFYRHYPRIGKDAVGTQIGDVVYDAFRK